MGWGSKEIAQEGKDKSLRNKPDEVKREEKWKGGPVGGLNLSVHDKKGRREDHRKKT